MLRSEAKLASIIPKAKPDWGIPSAATVLIDPQVLNTLPVREFRAGMAEVIKYGIIWDPELFYQMEQSDRLDQLRYLEKRPKEILSRSCQADDVVSKDEKKQDRAISIMVTPLVML